MRKPQKDKHIQNMASAQLTNSADEYKHFTLEYHAATLFSLHDPKTNDMYTSVLEGTMQRFSLKHGYGNIFTLPCGSSESPDEDYTHIGQFIGHVLSHGETKFHQMMPYDHTEKAIFDKYENLSFGIDSIREHKVQSDLINPSRPQPFTLALIDFVFKWQAKAENTDETDHHKRQKKQAKDTASEIKKKTHKRQILFHKISAAQFAAK